MTFGGVAARLILAVALAATLAGCVPPSEHDRILAALPTSSESVSCPPPGANAVHGPIMKRLDADMGDSAYVTVMMDCVQQLTPCPNGETCGDGSSGVVRVATLYLLLRRNGKWRVEKPVSASVSSSASFGVGTISRDSSH